MPDSPVPDPSGTTQRLAEWIATSDPGDVPAQVLAAARLLVLDGLGCGVFGAALPWTDIVGGFVADHDGRPEVTVWGTGRRASLVGAPLVNGTAMHAFEYDDLHPRGVIHAGAQVLPVAFALAEVQARAGRPPTGRELLHAIVLGFEVGARLGVATGAGQLARGFHPSPNTGRLAAAATASRLLGLDAERTADALGVAGSFGGYLMAAQYGAMVKRVHPGHAAQAGLVAALLAERGLTGTRGVVEAAYGGFAVTYADADPAGLGTVTDGLGDRWEIPEYTIKFYPCCGSNHTSIDAWWRALELRPGLCADDVAAVDVRCSTLTLDHVGWPYEAHTVTTAQMNLRFCLASAMIAGRFGIDELEPSRLADPRVVDLARRIDVTADPGIDALGRDRRHFVRLRFTLHDGDVVEADCEHPRGSARRPLSPAEVREKFRSLAVRALPEHAVSEVADRVESLGDRESFDITALMDLLGTK